MSTYNPRRLTSVAQKKSRYRSRQKFWLTWKRILFDQIQRGLHNDRNLDLWSREWWTMS